VEDPFRLERFVAAQDGVYEEARAELRRGAKTSHWMWFVFPQITGLGASPMSRRFAISSLDEARAYLLHAVLGTRLVDCAEIVADSVGRSAPDIFGPVDARKLHSSMTLFMRASPDQGCFLRVLDRYFDGLPDAVTDEVLASIM
jgi:uncharacterized protein (DUF1810 family)